MGSTSSLSAQNAGGRDTRLGCHACSLQAHAAADVQYVFATASVHPGGDELVARPGVAGVAAHPAIGSRLRIGERRCKLPAGPKALAAIVGKGIAASSAEEIGVHEDTREPHPSEADIIIASGGCQEEIR